MYTRGKKFFSPFLQKQNNIPLVILKTFYQEPEFVEEET